MLPNGGAMTQALRQLQYQPYNLQSSFQQGHASSHPVAWSQLLNGKTTTLPTTILADYDAVVGPPGAVVYDVLLRQSPAYTKVILVEEPDKDAWAVAYEAALARLQAATRRTSRSKISIAFRNMIEKMVVGHEAAQASGKATSSVGMKSARQQTSSAAQLRQSFAAEAVAMQGQSATSQHFATADTEKNEAAADDLQHPRAVALQLYEESVKLSIPPSQLLLYRYGDGWEPLCTFLEKPVPAVAFPPYDNGFHVLGNLQERVERAEWMLRFLIGLSILCLLRMALPYCSGMGQFLSDLYADYLIAFGKDEEEEGGSSQTAPGATGAERFEEAWQKRGGQVRRVNDGEEKLRSG